MNKKLSRRKFIARTSMTAAASMVIPGLGFSRPSHGFDPKGLPTRKLGKTGVDVPIMSFGAGSRWMSIADDDTALEILEYALNQGIYYWDTAASYGNDRISSEERIGKILPGRRKEVFMVTKVHERSADKAREIIERSLKRLGTDYIDLLHIHSIDSVEDAERIGDKGQVLEVLDQYRDEGIVKHIGFTGHTTAQGMKRAAELYDFDAMMIALNHMVKTGEEDFEGHAVPFAAKKGMGVIAMKVIRPRESVEGLDPSDLIRYALTLDYFSVANIGTDNMDVLKSNLNLVRNFKPLSEPEMDKITASLDPFFRHHNVAWMQPGYADGNESMA